MWALPKNNFSNCMSSESSSQDHFPQFVSDYDLGSEISDPSGFEKQYLQPDNSNDYSTAQPVTATLSNGYTATITKKIVNSDSSAFGLTGKLEITAVIQKPAQISGINSSYSYIPDSYVFTQTYSLGSDSFGNSTYTNEDSSYTEAHYTISDSDNSDTPPIKTETLTAAENNVVFTSIGKGDTTTTKTTKYTVSASYNPVVTSTTNPITYKTTQQTTYNYTPSGSTVDYTDFNFPSVSGTGTLSAAPYWSSITSTGPSVTTSSNTPAPPEDSLNNCLKDNMVTPTEGGQTARIEVDLSAIPTSPTNDPTNSPIVAHNSAEESGPNSDELAITSSVLNVDDPSSLKYTWEVYTADDANSDSWIPIPKTDLSELGATKLSGMGLNKIQFKLNFPKDFLKKYIKVRLTAEETANDSTREGYGEVVVPVSSSADSIQVFSTTTTEPVTNTTESGNNIILGLDPSGERCQTGMDKITCPVVKDEIVGLKLDDSNLSNFSWSLDGTPFSYQQAGTPDYEAFFPVLKEVGDQYTVSVTATDKTTGDPITITKNFQVDDPKIGIISTDNNASPVLLGNYVDLNKKLWPDYSTDQFLAQPGSNITLKADFANIPASFLYGGTYTWFIDNTPIVSGSPNDFGATINSDGSLSFPANKSIGDVYTVDIGATYSQDNDTKKLLNQNWNVALTDFAEQPIGAEITIQMTNTPAPAASAMGPGRKIMASLISAFPSYFTFLFKIVLTTLLFLASIWVILALIPRKNEN